MTIVLDSISLGRRYYRVENDRGAVVFSGRSEECWRYLTEHARKVRRGAAVSHKARRVWPARARGG